MSIWDQIKNWEEKKRLFLISPLRPKLPMVRKFYASSDLYRFLAGPWSDGDEKSRRNDLYADLDLYIAGDRRSVRLQYRKAINSNLARLHRPDDEVWEIQVRGRKPQTRTIGRFAARDVFVGFFWKPHNELNSKLKWDQAIVRCQTEWRQMFSPYLPVSGVTVDDYISNGFSV